MTLRRHDDSHTYSGDGESACRWAAIIPFLLSTSRGRVHNKGEQAREAGVTLARIRPRRTCTARMYGMLSESSAPSSTRHATTSRRPMIILVTGLLVGVIVGRASVSRVSAAATVSLPSEAEAPVCACSHTGVPSPVEAALKFSEANMDGSDKTTHHSYHLMYGPFLAPYLDKPVVRDFTSLPPPAFSGSRHFV